MINQQKLQLQKLEANQGDITNLPDNSSNIVEAINKLKSQIQSSGLDIQWVGDGAKFTTQNSLQKAVGVDNYTNGTISTLSTTNKTSLVSAVNEVNTNTQNNNEEIKAVKTMAVKAQSLGENNKIAVQNVNDLVQNAENTTSRSNPVQKQINSLKTIVKGIEVSLKNVATSDKIAEINGKIDTINTNIGTITNDDGASTLPDSKTNLADAIGYVYTQLNTTNGKIGTETQSTGDYTTIIAAINAMYSQQQTNKSDIAKINTDIGTLINEDGSTKLPNSKTNLVDAIISINTAVENIKLPEWIGTNDNNAFTDKTLTAQFIELSNFVNQSNQLQTTQNATITEAINEIDENLKTLSGWVGAQGDYTTTNTLVSKVANINNLLGDTTLPASYQTITGAIDGINTAITTNTRNIGDLSTLQLGDTATTENKSSLVNVANYLYSQHVTIDEKLTALENSDKSIQWIGDGSTTFSTANTLIDKLGIKLTEDGKLDTSTWNNVIEDTTAQTSLFNMIDYIWTQTNSKDQFYRIGTTEQLAYFNSQSGDDHINRSLITALGITNDYSTSGQINALESQNAKQSLVAAINEVYLSNNTLQKWLGDNVEYFTESNSLINTLGMKVVEGKIQNIPAENEETKILKQTTVFEQLYQNAQAIETIQDVMNTSAIDTVKQTFETVFGFKNIYETNYSDGNYIQAIIKKFLDQTLYQTTSQSQTTLNDLIKLMTPGQKYVLEYENYNTDRITLSNGLQIVFQYVDELFKVFFVDKLAGELTTYLPITMIYNLRQLNIYERSASNYQNPQFKDLAIEVIQYYKKMNMFGQFIDSVNKYINKLQFRNDIVYCVICDIDFQEYFNMQNVNVQNITTKLLHYVDSDPTDDQNKYENCIVNVIDCSLFNYDLYSSVLQFNADDTNAYVFENINLKNVDKTNINTLTKLIFKNNQNVIINSNIQLSSINSTPTNNPLYVNQEKSYIYVQSIINSNISIELFGIYYSLSCFAVFNSYLSLFNCNYVYLNSTAIIDDNSIQTIIYNNIMYISMINNQSEVKTYTTIENQLTNQDNYIQLFLQGGLVYKNQINILPALTKYYDDNGIYFLNNFKKYDNFTIDASLNIISPVEFQCDQEQLTQNQITVFKIDTFADYEAVSDLFNIGFDFGNYGNKTLTSSSANQTLEKAKLNISDVDSKLVYLEPLINTSYSDTTEFIYMNNQFNGVQLYNIDENSTQITQNSLYYNIDIDLYYKLIEGQEELAINSFILN